MKTENFIRDAIESINIEEQDSWSSSNALLLMAMGIASNHHDRENSVRVLDNLLRQIPVTCRFPAVACFYRLDNDEAEMKERLKGLKEIMDADLAGGSLDPMLLTFYTKYDTVIGGKGHYKQMLEAYESMDGKEGLYLPLYGVALIEGIASVDQAVYEYYDALKVLFKKTLKTNLEAYEKNELDTSSKALVAYAILKACRMKVILSEKYEAIGNAMHQSVCESLEEKGLNKGAVSLLLTEKER
ncbi:MAG: hypothetical protein K6C69_05875 [Lachnospiraceae bacterium]|nr:hypothetical protein [Lachnospiraceae bacterium]